MGVGAVEKRKAVFLDRDGVLNLSVVREGKPYPPGSFADLVVAPGVEQGCKALREAGFLLIGITNQPDVPRGITQKSTVEQINGYLTTLLSMDSIRVCYHDNADECECRKPKPGLILEAAHERGIDLAASFMVGDRWKDVEAGTRAGCSTVLIDNRYAEPNKSRPTYTVNSFREAVEVILMNARIAKMKTKIFADGADREGILALYRQPYIKGFTTNPTLMRKAGINDYAGFAKSILKEVPDRPFSFEVFADDMGEMERQAMIISQWGSNVYVKIPITNTKGESTKDVIRKLSARGLKLNITAMMTLQQVRDILPCFKGSPSSYVSIFAGRIADTACDPVGLMKEAVELLRPNPALELIWASPRELLNIFQAEEIGCQIITVTHDILKKLELVGKDLDEYSLDTVKMFYEDGQKSGFTL